MESCSTPNTNLCPGHVTGVPALLFSSLVNTLMAAQCALGGTEDYPEDVGHRLRQEYDFVIVGAGSAGAIIANRLTEVSNWTVLLVEAGGDPTLTSEIPGLTFSTLGSHIDWGYRVEPQTGSCEGMLDKRCNWPRGRALGGSSAINAMLYVRGHQSDFDDWAAAGNDGWGYEDVLRYFRKSSDYLSLDHFDDTDPMKEVVIQAWQQLGYVRLENSSNSIDLGVVKAHGTLHRGTRHNTGKAFLVPAKDRKNLHVAKNSRLTQVLIDPDRRRAVGVQMRRGDQLLEVHVNKEVVLSAGTVNSPQILMLSGIGPREHLEEFGIPVLQDLKVGYNLQDHVIFPGVAFSIKSQQTPDPTRALDAVYAYLVHRTGPLASLGVTDVVSFVSTENEARPDIQFHHFRLPYNDTFMTAEYTRMSGFRPEVANAFFGLGAHSDILLAAPTLLHPKSRGRVSLLSKDPLEHPRIQAGYLAEEQDVDTIIKGVQLALKLQETKALQDLEGTPEEVRLEECGGDQFLSTEYWKCLLRHLSNSIYHPAGTCKMGPQGDADAVVDPQLKVRGIRGLRVADASIMPTITSGNINAAVMMIGEKAADIIKREWSVL